MATPWEDPIKNAKRLTVFAGTSVTGGIWAAAFTNALKEFNLLSAANNFGVTLSQSATKPDPSGVGGADVQFESGDGTVDFISFGQKISVTVPGTAVQGDTKLVKTMFGQVQRVAKAFIVVPATPQADTSPPRVVGDGVKLVIAVHELIHACGLSDSDHNPDDLFFGFPQLRAGAKPADDKVEVNHAKRLPPLFLTSKTVSVIQATWK
ncbi:MAG: hypothetical protein ACR2I2_06470 [Bryobacteraceae bacterium]